MPIALQLEINIRSPSFERFETREIAVGDSSILHTCGDTPQGAG
jgi:hypothetical protein